MSNGVLDQVLEHALHERDVAAHEREIGTDACFQRNAALLRAKLKLTLLRMVAAGMSWRGTISPTEDCQAGLFSAVPQPIRNVKAVCGMW